MHLVTFIINRQLRDVLDIKILEQLVHGLFMLKIIRI
ncbi:Uncharacterised protein [Mycobacteroides abscessus subsp. abscessus]|nr:Uncharacterised protein [Mycobacteroides abscessus subsp. abscessus]